MKRYFVFSSLLLAFLVTSCDETSNQNSTKTETETKVTLEPAPTFNADSAYYFLEKQLEFGPRVPNTQAHKDAGNYLINEFKNLGATVTVQEFESEAFDGTLLQGKNIVASLNESASKRILLASHWDTRPFADHDTERKDQPIMGANDGASGVAVLLEVARVLSQSGKDLPVGVDIILFDLEDYGSPDDGEKYCLGSQYWSENKHKPNYQAFYGILLDMVGGKNTTFVYEDISNKYAGSILKKVWSVAHALNYQDIFLKKKVKHNILDDHYFVNVKGHIPMIDIIGYNPVNDNYFIDTWHTHQDVLENIDKQHLKAVGQTLIQTIFNEVPNS
ncbi:MAG: glutamine cyclotransferase [Thalassobius sp.]|nr:glutamine cyclotransferase [Thalassovita sp.]